MKVFISHSHEDAGFVEKLKNRLEETGLVECKTVAGTSHLGEDIGSAVRSLIDDCDSFVVVLTASGSKSPWVHQEIGYAIAKQKAVIPIVEEGQETGFIHRNVQAIKLRRDKVEGALEAVDAVLKYYTRLGETELKALRNEGANAEAEGDFFEAASHYLEAGKRYREREELDRAIECFLMAAGAYEHDREWWEVAGCHLAIAEVARQSGNPRAELESLLAGAGYFERDNELYEAAEAYRRAAESCFERPRQVEYYRRARRLYAKDGKSPRRLANVEARLKELLPKKRTPPGRAG